MEGKNSAMAGKVGAVRAQAEGVPLSSPVLCQSQVCANVLEKEGKRTQCIYGGRHEGDKRTCGRW